MLAPLDALRARRSLAIDDALDACRALRARAEAISVSLSAARVICIGPYDPVSGYAVDVDRAIAEIAALDGALADLGAALPSQLG